MKSGDDLLTAEALRDEGWTVAECEEALAWEMQEKPNYRAVLLWVTVAGVLRGDPGYRIVKDGEGWSMRMPNDVREQLRGRITAARMSGG